MRLRKRDRPEKLESTPQQLSPEQEMGDQRERDQQGGNHTNGAWETQMFSCSGPQRANIGSDKIATTRTLISSAEPRMFQSHGVRLVARPREISHATRRAVAPEMMSKFCPEKLI